MDWTPFYLENIFNSSWQRFNKEVLVHIDMTASHNCCRIVKSIRLRSGDWEGHFSKINLLSCSRREFKMTEKCTLLSQKQPSEGGGTVLILTSPKRDKKFPPPSQHHHHQQHEPLIQGKMDPSFQVVCYRF